MRDAAAAPAALGDEVVDALASAPEMRGVGFDPDLRLSAWTAKPSGDALNQLVHEGVWQDDDQTFRRSGHVADRARGQAASGTGSFAPRL